MEHNDLHERFTRLLIQHEPDLMRCILVVVPNRNDARDILQECSVAIWRRFEDYDLDRPFVPWALGFVRIEIRRFLRGTHRRAQLTERAATLLLEDRTCELSELETRENQLKVCLSQLSRSHREMLQSYYQQECSVSELAERSGRSVEAVYKSLQRIRRNLQRCIERQRRMAEA